MIAGDLWVRTATATRSDVFRPSRACSPAFSISTEVSEISATTPISPDSRLLRPGTRNPKNADRSESRTITASGCRGCR